MGALAWPADRASGRAALVALLERPEVSEAIFLASPSLHAEVAAWRARPDDERGRGIERALVKYVARMAARATPFGTFAGVAVVPVERQERLEVGAAAAHRRRTRVDNDVLFALAAALARQPEARARLAFAPNSSLTRVAGRLRYAEARPGADGRGLSYHLVAVEPTSYLDATLARARGGATLDALAAALCEDDPEIARDEADGFVAELAETQLLVPALGVAVTGPEPIDGMIAQLEAAGLAAPAAALVAVRAQLAAIDARGLGATPEGYAPVVETLQAAMAAAGDARTLDAARLFQVDLAPALRGAVGRDVVVEAERAIEALRRIGRRGEDPGLVEFRRAFTARWEDAMVPLAEVLDEEAGIGFEAASGPGSEGSPLLAGLPFPPGRADRQVSWGARERWLLARLGRAVAEGADEITLSDDDLRALAPEAAQEPRLPDAIAAMVRVGRRDGQLELLLESAGGPSGARLLGRFCHLDADIAALVRDHVAAEEALRPDAVFAEVVHLAEGRNGNILCRPVLRAHEIVYLGQGGAAAARQLGLDDLLVSVRGDRVILWSRRLDREVVPRLSSAHNARNLGLGVYRFLVAVQGQGVDGLGWSWGPLADAPFLPRVRRGRVVLERARWRLDADELAAPAEGAEAGGDAAVAAVQALRDARRLPRHVVLADADNELWVDLDDAL
ncbi:MAG: lantibiotic dehydratase family protein, partial [Myxococcales bacterium]|nr:lantibiotic dehydratase family protein [Myxococcales bacterium]